METKKDVVAHMRELLKKVNKIYAEQEHKPKARDYSMYDYKAAILADLYEADKDKIPRSKIIAYSQLARFYRARGSWS